MAKKKSKMEKRSSQAAKTRRKRNKKHMDGLIAKQEAKAEGDILAEHGMTTEQQHGAVMRAAAVPVSDFEGEYQGPGTYDSPGARLLQRITWEARMRKATGIPKLGDQFSGEGESNE